MELYGIESKFKSRETTGAYRSYVYMAVDENDAIKQFAMDPNHKCQEISSVYTLHSMTCDLLFQSFRNIIKSEERQCILRDIGDKMGDWGTHAYELVISDVGDEKKTVRFRPSHVHCKDGRLQLMVCTDGMVPNWIY